MHTLKFCTNVQLLDGKTSFVLYVVEQHKSYRNVPLFAPGIFVSVNNMHKTVYHGAHKRLWLWDLNEKKEELLSSGPIWSPKS